MRHLLFGLRNSNVDETATALGARFGWTFDERESDYFGIYRLAYIDSTEIKIVLQLDPEGELLEGEFEGYRTLVYVDTEHDFPDLEGVTVHAEELEKLRSDD